VLSGRKTFKSIRMFGPIGESSRFSEKYVLSLDTLRVYSSVVVKSMCSGRSALHKFF
jgi:hypothetical protein